MNITKYMDDEIIIKRGIDVLIKELGPIEALRFINIPKKKRMESVKRHKDWQKILDKDRFFAEVFKK
jgi:hypothetical protein